MRKLTDAAIKAARCELSGLGTAEGLYELPPERTKRFRPVLVPLSDLALEIIDEAIADKDQPVLFPSKFSDGDVLIRRDSIAQALNGKKNDKRKSGKVEDRVGIREFLKMDHFPPGIQPFNHPLTIAIHDTARVCSRRA